MTSGAAQDELLRPVLEGLGPDVRSARTTAGRQHSLLFWSRINPMARSRFDMRTRLGLARLVG